MSEQNSDGEILRGENISVSFSPIGTKLLDNLSFSIQKGELIGMMGASGAGKTTMLRLFNHLLPLDSGNLYFKRQPISEIPPVWLRQQIVLVPQEPKLLGMTGRETLSYPLKLQKLPPSSIAERIARWCGNLNIPEEWLERNELQLSLGQRQLIAIARALVMEPEILLLDEPTSALDREKATLLSERLKQLNQTKQTTIIAVNHQLEWLKNFARRIIHLQGGKIFTEGLTMP